ncbi:hypothetical protein BURPS1106B_0028 [Burkholderia pseudomallei 1106b]|uniref:Uncharacterized protein n=1 Tax=Burkholderia pseudomallei (strain 1106a) TaxID=357348 RepID=A3P6M4_BURP0|nr:hypothetical protein BURPS1106A_A1950 [Burkholderia pseudomallei 1106a]EES21644.1 hypothetical protein BURPS1106B_0028 [Burkholderia pseudomallei 1106b]
MLSFIKKVIMSGESISLIRFNGFNRFRIEVLFDCAAFRRCEVIWRENPHCVLPLRADVPVFPCGVFVRISHRPVARPDVGRQSTDGG